MYQLVKYRDEFEVVLMPEFRAAFESSPIGLLIINSKGMITLVNSEICRLFDYPRNELQGLSVEILLPKRYRKGHTRFLGSFFKYPKVRKMGVGRELYGLRKDGIEIPVEIGLTPVETDEGIFAVGSVVDITDRKRAEAEHHLLEEQLRQSQKMEALGQLATGIAHDINNILQAILGNAELAMLNAPSCQHVDDLYEVITNVKRGKRIVERILTFTHRKKPDLRPVDLKKQVGETFRLLLSTSPAEISKNLNVEPGLPHILADVTSVDQVILNLANNAVQAMPSGGNLDISLERFYAKEEFMKLNPALDEGCYVRLMVRDTGMGMDNETKQKAFDPFFTRKAPGFGTGLGLSVVQGLIQEYGGHVWIDSEIGTGTTVSCLFPAVDAKINYAFDDISIPCGNSQRILYIDDESILLSVNKRLLSGLGYRPTVFLDPRKALAVFYSSPADFDLAMVDYSMPAMNGIKFISELMKIRPGFPAILVSGSVKGVVEDQFREVGANALIRKPFTRMELAQVLFSTFHPIPNGVGPR